MKMKIVGLIVGGLIDIAVAVWALMLMFKPEPTLKDITPMICLLVIMMINNDWTLKSIQMKVDDK